MSLEDGNSPWGTRGEATFAADPPLSPHVGETSETGLFFLGPAPAPALFFHVCRRGQVLIKVPGSSKSCNKLDAAEICIEYSFWILPAQNWGCASSSLEAGSDVVFGLHQNSSAPLHVVFLLIFCSPGFEPSATLSLSPLWQDGVGSHTAHCLLPVDAHLEGITLVQASYGNPSSIPPPT